MNRQVPWLRVFVEGVVIVASILLAFGIEAWWDGVQDRAEEHEILLGLRVEFVDHRSKIVRIGDRWEAHNRGINQLLAAIESKALPPSRSWTPLSSSLCGLRLSIQEVGCGTP